MRMRVLAWAALSVLWSQGAAAVEGSTAAGPVGGSDIRSALPAPPGLYGGTVQGFAKATSFVDGHGRKIPALRDAQLALAIGGPFLGYVPEVTVLSGWLAFVGFLPLIRQCAKLSKAQDQACENGIGDPYVEATWSRFFGTLRQSTHPDAYPIAEGLAVSIGIGAVLPLGEYDSRDPQATAISAGANIWDVSPSVGVTYTTAPWFVEGTEFSAKIYWNNYYKNDKTSYRTGDLINVDFAATEHVGPLQVGLAGIYATQVEDDSLNGLRVSPNGRRIELLRLGGVAAYDIPSLATSIKFKATTTAHAENTVRYWSVVTSWVTKF